MASQIFPVPGPSQDAFDAVSGKIAHIDTSTSITNLSNIPLNSQGRISIGSSISPSPGNSLTVNYSCLGTDANRTLTVIHSQSGTTWINTYYDSAWLGWTQVIAENEIISIAKQTSKTFTIPANALCLIATWYGTSDAMLSLHYAIGSTSGTPVVKTIVSGSNITITPISGGKITIANGSSSYESYVRFVYISRNISNVAVNQ